MDLRIWNGILDTDRMIRYCSALYDRYSKLNFWLTVLTMILATGAMASVLASWPREVSSLVLLAVAAATVWSNYANYAGKSAMAEACASQYRDLSVEWERLWYNPDATAEQIEALWNRYNNIPRGLPLPNDEKLNDKVQEQTFETVLAQYQN